MAAMNDSWKDRAIRARERLVEVIQNAAKDPNIRPGEAAAVLREISRVATEIIFAATADLPVFDAINSLRMRAAFEGPHLPVTRDDFDKILKDLQRIRAQLEAGA